MVNKGEIGIDRALQHKTEITLSLNELRIIVNSLRAVEYWSEAEGESYLDSEGRYLKKRLEALYLGELEGNRHWRFESPIMALLDSGG